MIVPNEDSVSVEPKNVLSATVEIQEIETKQNNSTKEIVKDYFSDMPVMIEVALCESRFTHFESNGEVLRGRVNSSDVGVMQINEKYHAAEAVRNGYNIYTLEGNMAYARYLYERQGTNPWIHSAKCWNEVREVAFLDL